ncbi:MAG TPA: 16S rRNA (cytidine(1402)-2'-O)-methyltransferase [Thermoanaerobaculia bacterium]|nr:16S rRNA (cytidine(1402)-2'-O)-methyltransferase [Thermoanaerobaculia bacterium]
MSEGKLLVIATPIGNLSDASPRSLDAMRRCSRLLCEDTRHTLKLLRHFAIEVPLESYHEHNEDAKAGRLLDQIEGGATIGIVSDAGTPVLSDPGFPLVREARRRGITIEPIPGPFAGAAALSASGIPPIPFAFWGFAPHRSGERQEFYRRVAASGMTALVYESPLRLIESLQDAMGALGDVDATVARELTKLHEELAHGTLSELIALFSERNRIPGEITIVLAASRAEASPLPSPDELRAELERLRAAGMRRNDALKAMAEKYSVGKNELYRVLAG